MTVKQLTGNYYRKYPNLRSNFLSLFFPSGECKFNPTKGTPISWDSIKDGKNLTVEISKVKNKVDQMW